VVSAAEPFRVTLYDKGYARQGWLGDPESLNVVVSHNAPGAAEIVVGSRNAKLPLLMERGARAVIEYEGEHLLSGPVRAKAGKGPALNGSITFTVPDDFRLLHRVLGWPVPTAAVTAQSSEYDVIAGPAETVLKEAVQSNAVTRLGEPVTVGPDLGRGADINVSLRFHPLADLLIPAIDAAGIGVTVRQSGAGLLVECYEPQLHPRTLTEAGGVVTEWAWSTAEAEATNVIVGGQGEGTARQFALYTDAALSTAIGERIEVFRDARDTADGDVLGQRAAETFAETAAKSGLSVKLAETSVFRYGGTGGIRVGDRVRIEVGDGVLIEDTLRTVTLGWTRDAGVLVTPAIGDITDNTETAFAQALAKIAAGVRDLRRK
jgi:hypothetical protein